MEPQWAHADVFPLIARAIFDSFASRRDFVTHDEIVGQLLKDAEASAAIESAREANESTHSEEWVAHNMVAWFSQRITMGESDWSDQFDRVKKDGKWAYAPRSSSIE